MLLRVSEHISWLIDTEMQKNNADFPVGHKEEAAETAILTK